MHFLHLLFPLLRQNAVSTIYLPFPMERTLSTAKQNSARLDHLFRGALKVAGVLVLLIAVALIVTLLVNSREAFGRFGFWGFLVSSEWNPTAGSEQYGALTFIIGTVVTSLLALLFCIPFSLPVALFTCLLYTSDAADE